MRNILTTILVMASTVAIGAPVRDDIAAKQVSYAEELEIEPLNTDYIQVSPEYTGRAFQFTSVNVGYGTDFSAGARLVFDVTVIEWGSDSSQAFASVSGYGYMWCYLNASENLPLGRHTLEWVNQSRHTSQYHVLIDGFPSVSTYTTYWQLSNQNYQLCIGGTRYAEKAAFRGYYHSIELYDIYGNLRHRWVPHPDGIFYDEMAGTFTTIAVGEYIYGDLAEEAE